VEPNLGDYQQTSGMNIIFSTKALSCVKAKPTAIPEKFMTKKLG
jgi:hypothetical protein